MIVPGMEESTGEMNVPVKKVSIILFGKNFIPFFADFLTD